ncbi:MAG: hypothetical protein IKZ51_05480, partial [Bacteroidales bacterium]|nr:hypothetical protein [Bacteroidales bacterium]
ALSLAVVPVSCSESFSVEVTPAEPDMITFTCVLENDGTKLGIDGAGKTKWEPNDDILVHGNNTGVVVTLTESDISNEGRTATISVPGSLASYTWGLSEYYAAYPASAIDESVTKPYFYSVFKNTNKPLMVAYANGDKVFHFENVCGIIAFTIPSGHDFESYIFRGNNSETLGYGKYTVGIYQSDEETVSRTFPRSDAGWTNSPLTQLSGPVVCNGTTLNKVFIPLPIGASRVNLTSGFTIELVKNESVVKTLSTSTSITLHRQEMIKIGSLPVD